jgi:5'(3')-deoxyribonucleotidase
MSSFVFALFPKAQALRLVIHMNRIFVDMDGVVVDFDKCAKARCLTGDQLKRLPGAYLEMEPLPNAIAGVRSLIGMGFEVWLATKPPTGIPFAYADKAQWVLDHLPELKRRIIITHDKGLLGDEGDYLIDDRPHKANCEQFRGQLLPFTADFQWPEVLTYFRAVKKSLYPTQEGVSEKHEHN